MIAIDKLCKAFGGKAVLQDFSCELEEGRVTALMAPSGAGKTTLLRILLGLETADSGEITGLSGKRLAAVFQEDRLLDFMTPVDNIRLPEPKLERAVILREMAGDGTMTLHRAFDLCRDPHQVLREAESIGIDTILTSGQKNHCMDGRNLLKELIRELHDNQIEVILDVVFNHTAEGNECGPFISFKGFDNQIYYMLTPDGKYYNFSGCGNTVNCNHPVVIKMIQDCLRYWVAEYRVDGFRFDLASILGRNEDGSPMENPPLVKNLAYDSLLADTKLIAEAWDAGGLYQVGSFPAFRRWSEWNGRYRDDVREYLKGGLWAAGAALQRIAGSPDIYDTRIRGKHASVNFLTCHDGFTLYDLYSYNQKHNEANGWGNLDGSDDNRSWNCGAEGDTDQVMVVELRHRMMKNAFAVLLCSRGTPMFLAGDEFGNTQFGNNNAYCQDNEISWLDWTRKEKFQDVFDFCAYMTAFRKRHPSITGDAGASSLGFPEISFHGEVPWKLDFSRPEIRTAAVMFAGYDNKMAKEDCVYLLMNPYWEGVWVELPQLPGGYSWHVVANTGDKKQEIYQNPVRISEEKILVGPRSVIVLEADQQ